MRRVAPECHPAEVETFRCATCRHVLSVAVRLVKLPTGPHPSLLDHHHVNPPLLDPGTYAIDEDPYGRGRVVDTFVLSPGDIRGTRFIHDLAVTGCWSLVGWDPCMACDRCGALVASRTDDCKIAQETRLYPSMVVRETCEDEAGHLTDPFVLIADWDNAALDTRQHDTRQHGWVPEPTRPRPALTATRWGGRHLKAQLYRDDPPA
jgi:hypothetical protein